MQNTGELTAADAPAPCPLCGAAARVAGSVRKYPVRACAHCHFEFLHPQPDDAALAAIYGESYFLHGQAAEAEERMSEMKRATAARYLDMIGRLVPERGRRLLEIGCGHGDMLVEASRRGYEVAGVEFSPHAVGIANQRLGRSAVSAGSIGTIELPADYFDVVAFADVIEHVRDPQAFLRRVHGVLKPGGMAVLITPSLDSWSRRVLGRSWMEYKVEHLFYFSRRSIRELLRSCAFREIAIESNRKVLTLDYLWRHFDRFKVPFFSPLIGLLRRATPDGLAHRHIVLPASGLIAAARK
jgi:2-polyprenyl-3-methyl-5-hydroxy-6-metoxy-1,4-benzoquinol methylase